MKKKNVKIREKKKRHWIIELQKMQALLCANEFVPSSSSSSSCVWVDFGAI
ncbi:hypothetical protein ACMBCN_01200 [Candidatus Liberibacter asiaticus]|nr:hypothetical protein [Candidatus Liberibacter asiaticus]